MPETPFVNVEAAHEYVALLSEAVRQAREDVAQYLAEAQPERASRRHEALQLVAWKLERLEGQLLASRHLLNDLRRLRRLLLGDDDPTPARPPRADTAEPFGT